MEILLVDDRASDLILMSLWLKDHELSTANSWLEAVRIAEWKKFSAIIMDVMMPNMSGFETAKLIKKSPNHANTPIIWVSCSIYLDGKGDFDLLIDKVWAYEKILEIISNLQKPDNLQNLWQILK